MKSVSYWGPQFDIKRTKDSNGKTDVLQLNHLNLTMGPGSTHFEALMEFSRSAPKPFKIKFLSPKLRETKSPRGATFFGELHSEIEQILLNYPELRWWFEEGGLVVDEAQPNFESLGRFDRIIGPIVIENTRDRRISKSALSSIVKSIDDEGFELKENLQPAQWKPIAAFNQRRPKVAIHSFTAAADNPKFVRYVRRRLYVARDRYRRALQSVKPIR